MGHWNDNSKRRETRLLPAGPEAIAQAAQILSDGGLVAFPTETVYGLGADATRGEAVAGIYEAKQRPSFNPLISHVTGIEMAGALGVFRPAALMLAQTFWPGPLTLVVPATVDCSISALARAGLDTVALRAPVHPVARDIIAAFGRPVAAPSANRSGRISPTSAADVMTELAGRCDLVIDGGACSVGLESTIVDCSGEEAILLRPGGLAREEIERVLRRPLKLAAHDAAIAAPGMLASHYAPDAHVRLDASSIRPGEAVLDFAGRLGAQSPLAHAYADLSPHGDLREAAANLFALLRKLDASGARVIAVAAIPSTGLGEAIIDRLRRAAADRN
jgi:L-threonylcarbamoyladenylate synthase